MQKIDLNANLRFFYLSISQKSFIFALVIKLGRHIEILLLSNDCVIVPDLGGFMAHHVDARYDEEEQTFLPPLRTLGFNPQLKINDSLLALSYVEAYDISYPEAMQCIEDEVNELKMHLQNEGSYELNDIGTLTLNEDGNYVFSPCEAGILTPTLYGLGSFEMPRLKPAVVEVKQEEPAEETAKMIGLERFNPTKVEETDDEDCIRIKYSWIRNTVAVAAVFIAFFLAAVPTGKTEMMTRTISNINNSLLFGMMSKDTNTSKIEIKKSDISKAPIKVDTILKKDTAKIVSEAKSDSVRSGFCIVLASHVTKKNSEIYIGMLKEKGLDSAEVYMHKNIRRIICGNFKTHEEASQALEDIHKFKGLEEAWVYKFN